MEAKPCIQWRAFLLCPIGNNLKASVGDQRHPALELPGPGTLCVCLRSCQLAAETITWLSLFQEVDCLYSLTPVTALSGCGGPILLSPLSQGG